MSVESADQLHVVDENAAAAVEQVRQSRVIQIDLALDAAIVGEADEIDLRSHGLPSSLVEHRWNVLWDMSAE